MSLVLTRQAEQEVVVVVRGHIIMTIRVASIRGDKVRIAFEANRDFDIHRKEVFESIMAEEQQRSTTGDAPPTPPQR